MKIQDHLESFNEHKDTIFVWGIETKGLEKSQRIIGLHASRAILDLLSIKLQKEHKITSGKQLNHRWFKSISVKEKLPEFENNDKIIPRIIQLELLCENLSYGSKKPVTEIQKAVELFNELENELAVKDEPK